MEYIYFVSYLYATYRSTRYEFGYSEVRTTIPISTLVQIHEIANNIAKSREDALDFTVLNFQLLRTE